MTEVLAAPPGVEVIGSPTTHGEEVLTPHALAFAAGLHRSFNVRRQRLLADRAARQARFDAGELPDFLPNTAHVRADAGWRVAPAPADPEKTRELTKLASKLEATYGEGKYCPPGKSGEDCLDIQEITKIFAVSTNDTPEIRTHLLTLLKSTNAAERAQAEIALRRFFPRDSVNELLTCVSDTNVWMRYACAIALSFYPDEAAPHLPKLEVALKAEKDQETRRQLQRTVDLLRRWPKPES